MNQWQNNQQLTLPVSQRDHIQGDNNAPVTLVEYGDFQCPDCGAAYPIVKEVQKRLGKQLRFVYRNYPLPQHPYAEPAAEAAEAAGAEGKYWEMHDYLYEHQSTLSASRLETGAKELGLDISRFNREVAEHAFADRIEEDIESGDQSGVEGTPTFFINGILYQDSYDLESLQTALQNAVSS